MTGQRMTDDQVAELLARAAAVDFRRVTDEMVDMWAAVAATQGWTWDLALRAMVDHIGGSNDPVKPADITRRITEAKRAVKAAFQIPPHSAELADDGPAFARWAGEQCVAHMQRGLGEWARRGVLPAPLELED